ncbi:response regulator [Novispirillum itersonii]|uniref:response regulator n=1 Tax=Novispirillum itersonii TaxID=189 RepID=UPI000373241B|nr:response regulator [Novispirillum itersonii]
MNAHLLVIDDEPQIRRFLGISLTANGYRVSEADGATSGITAARDLKPDLVVLDLGLPDGDGQDVISAIRSFSDCPILILSVRADEFDKVEALDRGANDYMVKPFGIAELMARLRALLRSRSPGPSNDSLSLGPVSLSMTRRVIRRDGEEIHLSKREWDLLACLAAAPDHVLTHRHLLRSVWGPAHVEDTAYLRVYIGQLRQKLEEDPANPRFLLTEPGIGYRLKTGDEA